MSFYTLRWQTDHLSLLDQRRLPLETTYLELYDLESVAVAIETLAVRGAPAIGVAAAYGMALAAMAKVDLAVADARLRRTRPTAVNLFWALDQVATKRGASTDFEVVLAAAQSVETFEIEASRKMGEVGAALIPDGARILTHCNAGALATVRLGTALAVVRAAHAQGKKIQVYADETRPVLQGARLTVWELMQDGIDVTLVPDGAVAQLCYENRIDLAIVGADRIAKNGDFANKIGTRTLSCVLYHHGLPVYVAAPWSTVDLGLASGRQIPIEERAPEELTHLAGARTAPLGAKVRNPAFDVTPATWIAGIITERGFTGKDVAAGLLRFSE